MSIACPIWTRHFGDSMNISDAIPTSSSRNTLIVIALADNDGDPLSAGLAGGAAEHRGNRPRACHQSGDEVIDGAATSGSPAGNDEVCVQACLDEAKDLLR